MSRPTDPALNATVMASAGTGKTWQLVSRLTRLLFAGATPDAILAITFTRKAAAEMHTRLAERLLAFAAADDLDLAAQLEQLDITPTPAAMSRARALFEELLHAPRPLRTTTFHAFCQEILRRFPLEADVPPGFELIEKNGELRGAAWEALVSEATAEPECPTAFDLQQLLELCGGQANLTAALDAFLDHRGDWWAFTAGQQDAPAFATGRLCERLRLDLEADPFALFDHPVTAAELAEFRDLLLRHDTKTNLGHAERLADALHPESDATARFHAAIDVFLTKERQPRARKESKTQAAKMGADGEARFLALHALFYERFAAILDALAARETLAMNTAWYRVGQRLLDHYQRLKEEQRLLDFTDLEWRAYRLLTVADNAHWVQFKLDQRIDHLLVDEFQDTNPTQWRLLLPLLTEMAAGSPERRRSVFLVGDGKQSIYRFRRAEPKLFHVAAEWLHENLAATAFPLHVSYRSAPAVMAAVNRLFGADGPLAGQLDGWADHDTHHQGLWGEVALLPLIEAGEPPALPEREGLRNPLHEPRTIAFDDRYLREGRQMARRIRELIDAGTLVGPEEKARPLHYGDVLILVRSRTHVEEYETALREASIPYLGADRGTLLESLEVDDMVRLLQILVAPYDNLALAQVLRSPLFACSDADLTGLAGRGDWFARLLAGAATPGTPLARAADCLGRWHALAGTLPIHDLLDRVYSEGNVIARYEAAFPPHLRPRVRANLTRFLELALEIDHGRYPSLTRFLARLGELRERDEAPDEAPAAGGERVRIMTIHAAKGLEAPVVFLADAASGGANDRPYRALVEWPATAEAPDHLLLVGKREQQENLTLARLELEQAAERREAANLLYVALTRARQLLYISGCRPSRGDGLGWYGALFEALDETPLVSGRPPARPAAINVPVEVSIAPPPAALRGTLTVATVSREIAPSRHLGTLDGPSDGEGADDDARLRGIAIHRMLELICRGEGTIERVAAELQRPADDKEVTAWWREAQAVAEAPELAELFDPARYDQAWNEVPLQYTAEGCTVHGIIDRLLLRGDEALVLDYKSHRTDGDDLERLAAPYAAQLRYYADGVRQLWPGKRVRALLLFTAAARTIEVAVEP